MKLKFVPIRPEKGVMEMYLTGSFSHEVCKIMVGHYTKVGFSPPWVGYFAVIRGEVIGTGGFKGAPREGKVEIAYGTAPEKEGLGIGTQICRELTAMATAQDPGIRVTARTLMEEGASTTILKKNGFKRLGTVQDPEDGPVWEWEYLPDSRN